MTDGGSKFWRTFGFINLNYSFIFGYNIKSSTYFYWPPLHSTVILSNYILWSFDPPAYSFSPEVLVIDLFNHLLSLFTYMLKFLQLNS
jgi:hypothetical protein